MTRHLAHCSLRPSELGIVGLYPVYLQDPLKVSGINVKVLGCLGEHIAAQGMPFVCGGDWNVEPGELRAGVPLTKIHGGFRFDPAVNSHVFDGGESSINLDFYLLSLSLDSVASDASAETDNVLAPGPHRPV
eukprot:8472167-Pyramimonas_sp.AAC.1